MVIVVVVVVVVAATNAATVYTVPSLPTARDRSIEEWTAWVNGTGAWRVGLPFPISQPGTSFEDWLRNVTVSGFAFVRPEITERGRVLLVEGVGKVMLKSRAIQFPMLGNQCCAEAYLFAVWTIPVDLSNESVAKLTVWVPRWSVNLAILYTAESQWCNRHAEFRGSSADRTWAELAGQDYASCA